MSRAVALRNVTVLVKRRTGPSQSGGPDGGAPLAALKTLSAGPKPDPPLHYHHYRMDFLPTFDMSHQFPFGSPIRSRRHPRTHG